MKLREFFYFDRDTVEPIEDKSYDPSMDDSVLNKDDTRKTRLTLRQINKARKAAELHQEESKKDLVYIRQMYGLTANAEGV
jgi:Rps23 Pro-64 3,4-dihydroxylase Tpa1-like proline 4-hydroxylase